MADTLRSDQAGQELLARIAGRVAQARKAARLPRRVLSDMSGVSPRYLAQLEAGEGNISILLLSRVATALDLRVEDLLTDDVPQAQDATQVAALYSLAPTEVQAKARALLAPENPAVLRASRICLVGLRGAGKSTLGHMA